MDKIHIVAQLNDRVQPADRVTLYEDPLDEALTHHQIGRVTGGGTMLGRKSEITFVEVQISLNEMTDGALKVISSALEELGAPKGSKLFINEKEIPFGRNEGLALYLDMKGLSKNVNESTDVNIVVQEVNHLLGGNGEIHGFWQDPSEIALYMYGPSFEAMHAHLAEFMSSHPLYQQARVERIA